MWEFIHTSVKAGLQPHSSGFCPVAWTNGLPPYLVPLLEQMSAYHFLYPADQDPEGRRSPVELACRRIRYGTREWRIVGRIAGTELDYSGRLNRIAHLLIVPDEEFPETETGAAAICLESRNFMTSYQEPPQLLPVRRAAVSAAPAAGEDFWRSCALDPGWADAVAAHFRRGSGEPFYCIFAPGTPVEMLLGLIGSVASKLTAEERRRFTFSTYFSQNVPGAECYFRCIVPPESGRGPAGAVLSLIDPGPVPPELRPLPEAVSVPPECSVISPSLSREMSDAALDDEIHPIENQEVTRTVPRPVTFPSFTETARKSVVLQRQIPSLIRRPKVLLAGALVILILLAVLAVTLFHFYRASQELQKSAAVVSPPAAAGKKVPEKPAVPQVKKPVPPPPSPAVPQAPKPKPPVRKKPPVKAAAAPRKAKAAPAPKAAPLKRGPRFEVKLPTAEKGKEPILWSFRCLPPVPENLLTDEFSVDATAYVKAYREVEAAEKNNRTLKTKSALCRQKIGKLTEKKDNADSRTAEDLQKSIDDCELENLALNDKISQGSDLLRSRKEELKSKGKAIIRKMESKAGSAKEALRPLEEIVQGGKLPDAETERKCEAELTKWILEKEKGYEDR